MIGFCRAARKEKTALLGLMLMFFLSYAMPLGAITPIEISKELEALSSQKQELYRELAVDLRCPTCTGLSVLQSDAPFSLQIRQAVIDKLREDKSPREIKQFFTDRYGLWILRTPPSEGFHLLAWLGPLLIVFFAFLGLWANYWRRQSSVSSQGIRSKEAILIQMEREIGLLKEGVSL